MDIWDKVPVIKVAIRGANGRMGMQAIYASMENNEDILRRARSNELRPDDVWMDIVFGAFTADIPTVQQIMAGVMRSEKNKVLEGYDKNGRPIFRQKAAGGLELRTRYLEQGLEEEPQREHLLPFDRQEIVDTPEGYPAIKILSSDKKEVLSTIRHINVRLGELSGEAIMDRVLDTAYDLGANVLLSCVGDTAKKVDSMKRWLDKIHEKGYAIGFLESAPAKGWDSRMLSRQDSISVLTTRNFSPTGTLFRTGISLEKSLFDYRKYELGKSSAKFKKIFSRIVQGVIASDQFSRFAQFMPENPKTIQAVEGENVLVNFPPNYLTVISDKYLKFSFYEDNEYGFVCASMIPNLKALGLVFKSKSQVKKTRQKGVKYEAVTNIPGLFGTGWMVKAPEEIIARGGAMSTSSCTTNGNIVGDFIIFMALHCYFDFFYNDIKAYYLAAEGHETSHMEEVLEKKFGEFEKYLDELMAAHRAEVIRKVFNFYYDEISFLDTDMQHGLTRAESPDVVEYLRETSSGSMTEVPKILSLPERELDYFKSQRTALKKQQTKEKDADIKAALQDQIDKITASIDSIENHICIVDILASQEK